MIVSLALLLAAPQDVSPEVGAVMDRSRRQAQERRREEAEAARAARTAQQGQGGTLSPADPAAPASLPIPPQYAARFQACIDKAIDDPVAGAAEANAWQIAGGAFYARQCEGFAYARSGRWTAALAALRQAAEQAEVANDPASARLWAQAGNAALAGGDVAAARSAFDAAIAHGMADGIDKGETYLDRARALVALGEPAAARKDIDTALAQVPDDPLAWLLSATLARRMNDLTLARDHIAKAVKLASDDASVALEEGNIAMLSGQDAAARVAWQRAVTLSPDSAQAKSASQNLAQLAAQPAAAPSHEAPPTESRPQ
ncbi:MAG: tetratricopeptide repeat protein [Sphingobium sp.]|nr:tetratricopeptide repeat protein [Sphingobium sp.]